MIVKVQVSITTTAAARQVLIYNEAKTVFYQGDAGPDVLKEMGTDLKAFYRARRCGGAKVELVKRVAWRDW